MKKGILVGISALMALSLGACSTPAEKPEEVKAGYTAGTFTGTSRGMKGDMNVDVTFSDSAITKIEITTTNDTYGVGYGLDMTPYETLPGKIIETQSLNIDAITGATITSNAILSAVGDAVKQAGGDVDALKAAEVEKAAAKDETLDADVVIVGAGAAGMSAALEASNAGAKVIILEKQGIPGGATTLSGGKLLAAGTEFQEAAGFEGDTPEALYDYLKGVGGDLIDDEKLHEFTDNALGDFNWLIDNGVVVKDVEPIHSSITPWRVHNTLEKAGMTNGNGGLITVPLAKAVQATTAEIKYNVSANELLTNENGDVVGVVGVKPDGSKVTVNAKSVIIATGGYAQNKEMISRYPSAEGYVTSVPRGNVGDGLTMSEAVGAQIFNAPSTQIVFTSFTSGVGINEESGLIVNDKGERVVDEFTYQYHVAEALVNSDSKIGWYIASANDPAPTVQYAMTLDSTLKAESAEELAALMGVDPTAFASAVARYNELCAAGNDEDFGKPADKMIALEGTLYAIEMKPAVTVTYGGLVTDLEAQVLDTNNTPIKGLYAAGEVAFTGLFGTEYPCCGMAIGSAVRFGRIAGINAAK